MSASADAFAGAGTDGVHATASVIDGTTVLVPSDGLVEVPVGDEVIVWKHDRAIPLQLNPIATTIWWHLEDAPLDEVARDIATYYRQPVERVMPGIQFVTRSLLGAGLLRDTADPPEKVSEPSPPELGVREHERAAQITPTAEEWLERRATFRLSVQVGRVRFGVSSNTGDLHRRVTGLLADNSNDSDTATNRYHLIDAGNAETGCRYWLVSDTGLPLERTNSPDDLVNRLALHLAELAAVQRTAGVPLRLGMLEADDHAVAVQWDLLASRPVLEGALGQLGYRIGSGQWTTIDQSGSAVQPSATNLDAHDESAAPGLPLAAIAAWCGPGSLDVPRTHAEWAWTLAMFGCASPDLGDIDRQRLLETAVTLADTARLEALTDAGPSALLELLADISRSWKHG